LPTRRGTCGAQQPKPRGRSSRERGAPALRVRTRSRTRGRGSWPYTPPRRADQLASQGGRRHGQAHLLDDDLSIDGPNLAAQAIAAGLVDEYGLFMTTSVVGGGKRFFPDGVRIDL